MFQGVAMRIGGSEVKIFKIKNRRGFAAVCSNHLTEGKTRQEAYHRLAKALRRRRKRVA